MTIDRGAKKDGRRVGRLLMVVTVLLLLTMPPSASAFPLRGDASIGVTHYHQVIMMQGDDPSSTEVGPRGQVHVVDRVAWSVPWNSSEILIYIPPSANDVVFDNVMSVPHGNSTIFMPGDFSASLNPEDPPEHGWMGGEGYEGYYYWRFPKNASRDLQNDLVFKTDTDFEDADPEFTNLEEWNVSGGSLALAENVTSATYVSKRYSGGLDLVSINMTYMAEHGENMTFEVSADNGTTWRSAVYGESLELSGPGAEFRWRITMTQNLSHDATPHLDVLVFSVRFTPEYNEIWMEATYTLEMKGKKLVFDQRYPFDTTSSGFIYVGYVDEDMELTVEGTEVVMSQTSMYVGKTSYTHMRGDYEPIIVFTFKDLRTEEETNTSIWLYIGILVLVLIMVLGISMVLMADRRPSEGDEGGEDDVETMEEDLEERKEDLLETIRDLDEDHRIGLIDDEEHATRREELKTEAVEVMKSLDEGSK